ncbi:YoaK family protein [Wenyingzhuangia sp. 2_MG-2023]|uniref:YoaK family protein n=1 Tax=Wenyingzhuangia sp. 2_MG-2023 TaxID=3062639 RepID=UPI0026E166F5|nr:YoaK family protein [Wenyingzhuangia sp. 2_MG-2023]MDO6739154.1 YoaK family protein [Wenyingzhuangia sp. 2_MG-2023]
MFKHQGKSRTLKHNLRIATVLSFVAGIVNVTGFLSFKQLTTNVTGHFALFMNDVAHFEFWKGTVYFLYIFSFFFGSFFSSFLIELFKENKKFNVYVVPTTIECLILISIATISNFIEIHSPNLIACLLLFAMGLQNSYVTKISNTLVRTTHLTGLFTDLGIEISHLFFPKSHPNRDQLKANIKLRFYIISFFFMGGLVGGFLYSKINLKLNTLIFGAVILALSLYFDDFRYQFLKTKRKYIFRKKQR